MAREKEFSVEGVVEAAADVFTEHGYDGTSLAMLLEATGLGKQSLYNTFGDKAGLYLKAIDCAAARSSTMTEGMRAAENGRAAIALYFSRLVDACASNDPTQKHCVVTSGLLEGIDDPLIAQTLNARWQSTHEMLREAVERGQRDGSIVARAPSAELADVLISIMTGLRVTARTPLSGARLASAARLATSILDFP